MLFQKKGYLGGWDLRICSLARLLREPIELSRGELLANLRLHGEVRRDQGYSMAEVLAEFDGLSEVITRGVTEIIEERQADFSPGEILEVVKRLAAGLRSISYIAMGTFAKFDSQRSSEISGNLEKFSRAISHEMRNPLNTLALSVECFREAGVGPELEKHLDIMDGAVRRCRYLLEKIRILTIAESARSGNHKSLIEDAVSRIVKEFTPSAKAVGIRFDVQEKFPNLNVESLPLYLVLANLVSNAVKYSDAEKSDRWIRIRAVYVEEDHDSGFCEISASDNGVGIPEEFISRIFQQGFHAHAEVAEGTGVGLYLVQQSLIARGGSIDVDSVEGEGTTMRARMRCLHNDGDALTADQFRVEHLMGEVIWNEIGIGEKRPGRPHLPERNDEDG